MSEASASNEHISTTDTATTLKGAVRFFTEETSHYQIERVQKD
jgi:hypothetical protein